MLKGKRAKTFQGQTEQEAELEEAVQARIAEIEDVEARIKKISSTGTSYLKALDAQNRQAASAVAWLDKFCDTWCPDAKQRLEEKNKGSVKHLSLMGYGSSSTEEDLGGRVAATRSSSTNNLDSAVTWTPNVPSQLSRSGEQPQMRGTQSLRHFPSRPASSQGEEPPTNTSGASLRRTTSSNSTDAPAIPARPSRPFASTPGESANNNASSSDQSRPLPNRRQTSNNAPLLSGSRKTVLVTSPPAAVATAETTRMPVARVLPQPGVNPGFGLQKHSSSPEITRKTDSEDSPLNEEVLESADSAEAIPKPTRRQAPMRGVGLPASPIKRESSSEEEGTLEYGSTEGTGREWKGVGKPQMDVPIRTGSESTLIRPPPRVPQNPKPAIKSMRNVPSKQLPATPPKKDDVFVGNPSARGSVELLNSEEERLQGEVGFANAVFCATSFFNSLFAENAEFQRSMSVNALEPLLLAIRDYLRTINTLRKSHEKSRTELINHLKNVERERAKPILDVIKLFQMEKESAQLTSWYQRTLHELSLTVLDRQKEIELARIMLRIFRVHADFAKYAELSTMQSDPPFQQIKGWAAVEKDMYMRKVEDRAKKQSRFQLIQEVERHKDMVDLLTADNGVFLTTLIEFLNDKATAVKRAEILNGIRQIFFTYHRPVPEILAGPNERPDWKPEDLVLRGHWNQIEIFLKGHYDLIVRYLAGTSLYPDIVITFCTALSQIQTFVGIGGTNPQ